MGKEIQITSYLKQAHGNVAVAIRHALRDISETSMLEPVALIFDKGTYHIHEEKCSEAYHFIANHDSGLKRMAFNMKGMQNITIDANESLFLFHGRVIPFVIDNSQNIKIKNLAINYTRPFFSQGEVVKADHEQVMMRIDRKKYPYYIKEDMVHFYSENEWESTFIKWFAEFDPERKAPTYKIGDTDLRTQRVKAKQIDDNIVCFYANFSQKHKPGNIINITHEHRYNPGFLMNKSENVTLENVTIYHAGAIGIIGQTTKNITLNGVSVTAEPDSGRVVSSNNDATHFVNCEGKITLNNCLFQHQLDDATNIHGIYNAVSEVFENNVVYVNNGHFQQAGLCVHRVGDRVAVIDVDTRLPKGYASVKKISIINKVIIELELETETIIEVGDLIENYERMPEIEITNCRIGDNRARGILLSSNKKTVIKNNHFYTSGSAIQCGGELVDWYESGVVNDVTISNNKFTNCNYAKWGEGTIKITPSIQEVDKKACIHHNVTITDNIFYTFKPTVLNFISVDGITFRGNIIEQSNDFEPFGTLSSGFEFEACENIEITDNKIIGFDEEVYAIKNTKKGK